MVVRVKEIPADHIEKVRVLGRGSFGVVYEANYDSGNSVTQVAYKQIIASNLSPEAQREFLTEIAVMAGLKHRNIVQLFGYSSIPRGIVMEYMPKGSLADVLHDKSDSFSWRLRLRVVQDMANGLAALHERRILHRDIKSLNVLLDDNYTAKLSDFGLSKIKAETRTITPVSAQSIGTVAWMAPELFSGLGAVYSTPCDVYSFGITCWEIASREYPYIQTEQAAIPFHVVQGRRENIPKDCPPKFANLIRACWNGNPQERPSAATIAEFITSTEESLPGSVEAVTRSSLSRSAAQPALSGETRRSTQTENNEQVIIDILRQKHHLGKQIEALLEEQQSEYDRLDGKCTKAFHAVGKCDRQGVTRERLCREMFAAEEVRDKSDKRFEERIKALESRRDALGERLDRLGATVRQCSDLYKKMLREEKS